MQYATYADENELCVRNISRLFVYGFLALSHSLSLPGILQRLLIAIL